MMRTNKIESKKGDNRNNSQKLISISNQTLVQISPLIKLLSLIYYTFSQATEADTVIDRKNQ